jgi:hypothetical protein
MVAPNEDQPERPLRGYIAHHDVVDIVDIQLIMRELGHESPPYDNTVYDSAKRIGLGTVNAAEVDVVFLGGRLQGGNSMQIVKLLQDLGQLTDNGYGRPLAERAVATPSSDSLVLVGIPVPGDGGEAWGTVVGEPEPHALVLNMRVSDLGLPEILAAVRYLKPGTQI